MTSESKYMFSFKKNIFEDIVHIISSTMCSGHNELTGYVTIFFLPSFLVNPANIFQFHAFLFNLLRPKSCIGSGKTGQARTHCLNRYWTMWMTPMPLGPSFNTLRPRQMAAIFQTKFSNAFSWIKMYELQLRFHWSLFPMVKLIIFQRWFR